MEPVEREWQFTASSPDAVRAWLLSPAGHDGGRVEERHAIDLIDTYYDTPDWIIHRAGYALRVRRAGDTNEITLKSLHPASAEGLVERRELSEQLSHADPQSLASGKGHVASRVRALTGPRPLEPLFQIHTHRERYALHADSDDAAEIALDSSRFAAPGRAEQVATRLEVECLNGAPKSIQTWVDHLSRTAAVEPAPISKFQMGLAAAGLTPPSRVQLGEIEFDASTSVRDAAFATFRRHLQGIIEHEPGTRDDENTEDLHAMRVAARRLDATMRMYEGHVPQWVVRSRPALKRLIRALGTLRDLHLQLAHLRAVSAELPESQRQSLEWLREHMEADRRRARGGMLRTLDSDSVQRMLGEWVRNVRDPPAPPTGAEPLMEAFAAEVIARDYRKLRKRAKRIARGATADEYHDIRRGAKRLRYVVEALGGLYGDPASRFLRALTRFQDVLGEYQDAHVRVARLTRLASESSSKLPGETLFIMGQLTERDSRLMRRLHERMPKAWERVRGKRWKAFRGVIRKQADARPGESDQSAQEAARLET